MSGKDCPEVLLMILKKMDNAALVVHGCIQIAESPTRPILIRCGALVVLFLVVKTYLSSQPHVCVKALEAILHLTSVDELLIFDIVEDQCSRYFPTLALSIFDKKNLELSTLVCRILVEVLHGEDSEDPAHFSNYAILVPSLIGILESEPLIPAIKAINLLAAPEMPAVLRRLAEKSIPALIRIVLRSKSAAKEACTTLYSLANTHGSQMVHAGLVPVLVLLLKQQPRDIIFGLLLTRLGYTKEGSKKWNPQN